jgi:hypothetical protein
MPRLMVMYLPGPDCTCLDLIIPAWTCLYLPGHVCTCLDMFVPAWFYLDLHVKAWTYTADMDLNFSLLDLPRQSGPDFTFPDLPRLC